MPEVLKVDRQKDFAAAAEAAGAALCAGKLVAFPTETVYGLGALATLPEAMARLRAVKARPDAAFTVHLASPRDGRRFVADVPPRARWLMAKAMPGPITVLLPAGGTLADPALGPAVYRQVTRNDVIGLRCPDDELALAILSAAGAPVLASSANLAGRPAPHTADDVRAELGDRFDLLIDGGPTRFTAASTIVKFDGPRLVVVRAGVLDAGTVERLARRTVLFVCTGNTCRSPMAAALARQQAAAELGRPEAELGRYGYEVLSAGAFALNGLPATALARAAVGALGADLENHRARKLTNDLLRAADVIFCMTREHLREVARLEPAAVRRALPLDPEGDIEDPIGGDERTYDLAARRIVECLKQRRDENLL